jgi:putative protein-disulfide isomerase
LFSRLAFCFYFGGFLRERNFLPLPFGKQNQLLCQNFNMEKPTLIYIYDALCGWCYGFSPVMQKLYEAYQDRIAFEVLSGGMITGRRVQPLSAMADYIRQASQLLAEVTGVSPSEDYYSNILEKGTYRSDSLPPAIALNILKEKSPEDQFPLAQAIQHLYYTQGQDLNQVETYLPLAREKGWEEETFKKKFVDPAYADRAREEFKQVQEWGLDGFPAVLGKKGTALVLISHGYQPFEQVNEAVKQLLEE